MAATEWTAPPQTLVWEVQRRSSTVWSAVVSRAVTTSAYPGDLGRAALAAHLMGVDHESDLDDRRAVVRQGGPYACTPFVVTEGDLERYLREQGYYEGSTAPALRAVLPQEACAALPDQLRAELGRRDRPGPID